MQQLFYNDVLCIELCFLYCICMDVNANYNYKQEICFELVFVSSSSSSSFEGHPLQARHKQNWGRGFILLLSQTAALPGSDAGSDVIKPASSFVIQNRQTTCSMWCPMYRARC